MNSKKITLSVSCLIIALLVSGCGGDHEDSMDEVNEAGIASPAADTKAQNVFYSIPSPIETTSLLKAAGAKYNAKYLNPTDNLSKYLSVDAKALNLGVYGADLSFTSIFDKTQESILYLRCANKLATSIGISGAFDEKTTARVEGNMDNRDSLLAIISDSFWTADSYLKENGQPGVSALIIAGGWIEGLYIATRVAADTKSELITTRIGEQKLSLDNLIALLEDQKVNNASINDVLGRLQELKDIYNSLEVKSSETKVSTDKEKSITTIGNDASFKLNDEQLEKITSKINEIRSSIVK